MRAIGITFALILMATAVRAQQPPQAEPPTKTYSSASDVMGLIAKAKSERKDGQANVTESILQLAPYGAHLEYRASIGPAAIHERDAEFMYVIDGSATMVNRRRHVAARLQRGLHGRS
jgi:hypothetical protein